MVMTDDAEERSLVKNLNAISIASSSPSRVIDKVFVLDAGYGFPREKKVRKEKINAIALQLSNFLTWQMHQQETYQYSTASIKLVGCPDENIKILLENRTLENIKKKTSSTKLLPPHVTVSCESLEQCLEDLTKQQQQQRRRLYEDDVSAGKNHFSDTANDGAFTSHNTNSIASTKPVYLSPDAHESLDPSGEPPTITIIGLLVDRRVKPNRSRDRANEIGVIAKRWPLEDCFKDIDACEPLNVDCILEGMQQWWWNSSCTSFGKSSSNLNGRKEAFVQAASQAIHHHAERHPSRPLHITKTILHTKKSMN